MSTEAAAKDILKEVVSASKVAEPVYESMEEILGDGATQVEYETIDGFVPGKKVRIGSVTAQDMIAWSQAVEEEKRTAGLRLITKSLVNSKGERYADDPKNIEKFATMRHKETERMVRAILKLNGMNVKDQEKGKND